MNDKIKIFVWLAILPIIGVCQSVTQPPEATIGSAAPNPLDLGGEETELPITFYTDNLAPVVYRNVGCGGETFDFETDYEVHIRKSGSTDWHALTGIEVNLEEQTISGIIPENRWVYLNPNEYYDARITQPNGIRVEQERVFTTTDRSNWVIEPPPDSDTVLSKGAPPQGADALGTNDDDFIAPSTVANNRLSVGNSIHKLAPTKDPFDSVEATDTDSATCASMGDCYSDCWHCASTDYCNEETTLCQSNGDCVNILDCMETFCTGILESAWKGCIDNCRRGSPLGIADFDDLRYCVLCDVCRTGCDGEIECAY